MSGIFNLILASGSSFKPIANSTQIIPIVTVKGIYKYLVIISTSGEILAGINLGSASGYTDKVNYQRYANYLYLLAESTSYSDIQRVDLSNGTITTISHSSGNGGLTNWTRVSASKLMKVNVSSTGSDSYSVLDLDTGTITTNTYTAKTAYGYSGPLGLVSMYSGYANGLSGFNQKVYWTSASGLSYDAEINSANFVTGTLSSRSIVNPSAMYNYSRVTAAVGTYNTCLLGNFANLYKCTPTGISTWYLGNTNVVYNSETYSFGYEFSSPKGPLILTGSLQLYAFANLYDSGIASYRRVLCKVDFSAATNTQTPTVIFALPYYNNVYDCQSVTLTRLSETGGYVAILYQDIQTGVSSFVLKIINGTTVINTYSLDLAEYSDARSSFVSGSTSELGIYT